MHNKNQEKPQSDIRTDRDKGQPHSSACPYLLRVLLFQSEWSENKARIPFSRCACTETFNEECLWQRGAPCPPLTWLTVYLCQHVLDGVLLAPQGLGVRGGVAVAPTPLHHVLGFQGGDVVEPGVLLYDFLEDLSHCHRSLPLWPTKEKAHHTGYNIYGQLTAQKHNRGCKGNWKGTWFSQESEWLLTVI